MKIRREKSDEEVDQTKEKESERESQINRESDAIHRLAGSRKKTALIHVGSFIICSTSARDLFPNGFSLGL
jgi:hypothetical protein